MGHLPDDKHFLAFVNLNEIIRQSHPFAYDFLFNTPGIRGVDVQAVFQTSIGSAAASYTLEKRDEGGLDRYAAVLTLFPE